MARKNLVMMCGPSLCSKGGIASAASTLLAQEELRRMSVEYVATWSEGPVYRRFVTYIKAVLRVAAWARSGRVVHLHMASRGSFFRKAAIQALAQARGARTLIHLHGAQFHTFARDAPRLVKRAIRGSFRRADSVVVLSESWKERVAAFSGRTDAIVLPNPVEIPVTPATFDEAARVAFLGRLGRRKGTYDLLEAIRLLQESGLDDARWVLCGDGDVSECRRAADALPFPDLVEVPGWLSVSEVSALLSQSWVFCLPSYDEGLPIALLEAMGAGLACITTPVGGIPEYIDDGVNGVFVPVGEPRSLAQALGELLSSRDKCVALGRAARATVEERCAAGRAARRVAALYQRLLSETSEHL